MKRKILWPALPLLSGLLCFLARRWQFASAFEGDFEFSKPFAPASILLTVLLLLCCALFCFLAKKQSVDPALVPGKLPFAPGDQVLMTALVLSAFLMLAAAPMLAMLGMERMKAYRLALLYNQSSPGGDNGVLAFIAAALALLSFFDLLRTAKALYRGRSVRRALWLPIVTDCFWLMEVYRSHAPQPTLWHYAPLMLAIVCSLMLTLEWAGFFSGVCHPRRTLWYAAMAIVLALSTGGGKLELKDLLLLLSHVAAALGLLWHMPNNVTNLPEPPVAPAEENMEEDTHE